MTGIDITGIVTLIRSQALTTGKFATVNGHEPSSAPQLGTAISYAFWVDSIEPVETSGLASVSGLIVFQGRVFTSMFTEPGDDIDPRIVDATSALIGLYCGDLDLGGSARSVDIFGMSGTKLSAKAGHLTHDNKAYRTMDITLPVIVNDIWDEVT